MNLSIAILVSDMLATRQPIIDFFANLNLDNTVEGEVVFDFNQVKFISRSAADQLYKEFQNLKVPFQVVNQNENIIKMLEIVKKTQNGSNRNLYEVPVIEFTNNKNLKEFLYKMV
jgi:hypothetical protein